MNPLDSLFKLTQVHHWAWADPKCAILIYVYNAFMVVRVKSLRERIQRTIAPSLVSILVPPSMGGTKINFFDVIYPNF